MRGTRYIRDARQQLRNTPTGDSFLCWLLFTSTPNLCTARLHRFQTGSPSPRWLPVRLVLQVHSHANQVSDFERINGYLRAGVIVILNPLLTGNQVVVGLFF